MGKGSSLRSGPVFCALASEIPIRNIANLWALHRRVAEIPTASCLRRTTCASSTDLFSAYRRSTNRSGRLTNFGFARDIAGRVPKRGEESSPHSFRVSPWSAQKLGFTVRFRHSVAKTRSVAISTGLPLSLNNVKTGGRGRLQLRSHFGEGQGMICPSAGVTLVAARGPTARWELRLGEA